MHSGTDPVVRISAREILIGKTSLGATADKQILLIKFRLEEILIGKTSTGICINKYILDSGWGNFPDLKLSKKKSHIISG